MLSETFGEMNYEHGWFRSYDYPLFGSDYAIRLFIPCDEGQPIEPAQKAGFLKFDANKQAWADSIERALFDYYLSVMEDRREMAGPALADQLAPRIDTPRQLATLIEPTELVVQQSFGAEDRIVGLLFDCAWDPALGLAVRFVNETIEAIGAQDIVL